MSHDVQQVRSFEHPGEGRKRAKSTPKGRQVDPTAAHEIEVLLGDRPRRRDLLIEHLHLIQDTYRQISAAHLAALADEMKLSFAEVFETATFYAHFDVVKEGEADIPPLTIRVCDSLTCAMLGAEKLLQELQTKAGPGIRVVRAPCVGRCDTAPAAEVGHHFVDHASVASVLAAAKGGDTHAHLPDYIDYDAYVAGGGYALLKRLRSGALPREDLLKALDGQLHARRLCGSRRRCRRRGRGRGCGALGGSRVEAAGDKQYRGKTNACAKHGNPFGFHSLKLIGAANTAGRVWRPAGETVAIRRS